ncbi:hypothetical protein [Actinomadura sp. 9N215]
MNHDNPEEFAVVNGWRFDPQNQEWTKRTSTGWLVVKGDLENPPTWA